MIRLFLYFYRCTFEKLLDLTNLIQFSNNCQIHVVLESSLLEMGLPKIRFGDYVISKHIL
ncbi:hypothetical protein C2G38_2072476 [Gigaspora rosea]|uniref:Uncharacterized protein n=1 Tax=Gigaspora rosea TaxID=44941 RepID=A0A397VM80_9GLOM|nr:hypothetical protein C2G38_2072476 [Gigaspora rosea]